MRRLGSRKDTFIYERIRKIERGGLAPRVRALGQTDRRQRRNTASLRIMMSGLM